MENCEMAFYADFSKTVDDEPASKFESINRWRNSLKGGNYETQCLREIARYCCKFKTTPDDLVSKRIKEQQSQDPRIRSKAEDRLLGYHKALAKRSSGAAICMYRRIKSFYRANYVALHSKDPGYTVQREQDYLASKDETRKMCELLDMEGKAYLLTLSECCGRPGAVAKILYKDISEDLNKDLIPMKIWLQHKVKVSRKKYFNFVCKDARDALKLLIESRGKPLKPNDKVFPTGYSGLRKKVMAAAVQIGIYVEDGGIQPFRLHTFRKRAQTILEKAHIPLNWVDRMLGHVPRGAQGATYSLPDVEAMREEYAKAMPDMAIYEHAVPGIMTKQKIEEAAAGMLARFLQQTASSGLSLGKPADLPGVLKILDEIKQPLTEEAEEA